MPDARIKCDVWSLTCDLPGFVDVQEAIPAASSTAKPQAEEAASQGEASEPLAQECLRGNGYSWKAWEEKTQIQTGKDERHIWARISFTAVKHCRKQHLRLILCLIPY